MFRRLSCFWGLFALSLAACAETGNPGGPGTGRLSVRLTDAPFPLELVERADIFVVRVDGRLAATDDDDAEDTPGGETGSDPSRGWVTIAEPNRSYDILSLRNGTTVELGEETLPTGNYAGFRLVLDTDQSSVTLADGTVLRGNSTPGIKWPSAGKSGIKIVLDAPVELTEGGTVMVVDFDLGRSFVMRGNSIARNGLLFKPVVHAVLEAGTGTVSGEVRQDSAAGLAVADALVELLKAGTPLDDTVSANVLRSARSDAAGKFVLSFVVPGTYALRATPPASLDAYEPVLEAGIEVEVGDTTEQVLVLPKKAPPT